MPELGVLGGERGVGDADLSYYHMSDCCCEYYCRALNVVTSVCTTPTTIMTDDCRGGDDGSDGDCAGGVADGAVHGFRDRLVVGGLNK